MIHQATFGAGCFWGIEQAFCKLKGTTTCVGFMGGSTKNPSYHDAPRGGHTEVIHIEYDPKIISFHELLKLFWTCHDPTQQKKIQYQSVIFYHTDRQQTEAIESKLKQEKNRGDGLATQILPAKTFYKAEAYHQRYLEKRSIPNMVEKVKNFALGDKSKREEP
jgi:peptide-methionine (S)-S-oxide reductase